MTETLSGSLLVTGLVFLILMMALVEWLAPSVYLLSTHDALAWLFLLSLRLLCERLL